MGKAIIFKDADFSSTSVGKVKVEKIVSTFEKNNGYFFNLDTEQLISNNSYFTTTINVENGSETVNCRFVKSSGGGLGMAFFDANDNMIGSFSNTTLFSGTKITVPIPTGTVKLTTSYWIDSALPPDVEAFDGFVFIIN